MVKEAAKKYPAVQQMLDKAHRILNRKDFLQVLAEGPEEELAKTVNCQPAMFIAGLAAAEAFKEENKAKGINIQCQAALGLSVGEYTALTHAGTFTFDDGLKLVKLRGDLMQKASDMDKKSAMLSVVGCNDETIAKLIEHVLKTTSGKLVVANHLSAVHKALSGDIPSIELAEKSAAEFGGKIAKRLPVSGGFHSEFMTSVAVPIARALREIMILTPNFPVIANIDAKPYPDRRDDIIKRLVQHVSKPVWWEKSINSLLDDGFREFHEMGAGTTLTSTVKAIAKERGITDVNASNVVF